MKIKYPEIGICGLSCRLCPRYHAEGSSRCGGCKSEFRMAAGCPFITCAVKKKGLEFCWDCDESRSCEKWMRHRELGRQHDSFVSYQRLEDNIQIVCEIGIAEFEKLQKIREKLLRQMLDEFNEGRSKSYYCVAATVLEITELKDALGRARKGSKGLDTEERSKVLRSILDEVAAQQNYVLKLRK